MNPLRHERNRRESSAALQWQINPCADLLPEGRPWKVTLFNELPDAHERQLPPTAVAAHAVLPRHSRVIARANKELPDRHPGPPSAGRFLRFPVGEAPRTAPLAIAGGAPGHNLAATTTPVPRT